MAFPIIIIGVNFDVVYAEYKATKTRAKRREKEQKNENNMKASMVCKHDVAHSLCTFSCIPGTCTVAEKQWKFFNFWWKNYFLG